MERWKIVLEEIETGVIPKPRHVSLDIFERIEDEYRRVELLYYLVRTEEHIFAELKENSWVSSGWVADLIQVIADIYGTITREQDGDFPPTTINVVI